jgi:hypothetical protein
MTDSLSLHIANSSDAPISRHEPQETKPAKKKNTPIKKRTFDSFIPDTVEEDLKKGEKILKETDRTFAVSTSSSVLFSDSKVEHLNGLLSPALLKNLHQCMVINARY